jgi:hypothetical protein
VVPGAFQILFDHAQSRVQVHPVFATIKGKLWDAGLFSETWIEPITNSLCLRPMCKYTGWQAVNTGKYAKPAIGAYEFQTSANWVAFERIIGGGATFMSGSADNANPGWIRTATAPGLNRGINLAIFGYGAGELTEIAQFGWDDTDVTYDGSDLGFRLYSDGRLFCYKAGEFVGEGRINLSTGSPNVPLEIMILPMRRREILILGQGDDGFRLVFEDIDEDEASPVITPNQKVWFKMIGANATRCQVQVTPLKFEESGFANSVLINFQRPPASGATLFTWSNPVFSGITTANVYGDKAYAGTTDLTSVALVESDGVTAFVADGTLNTARMKITLEGDGNYTPFIYGATMMYEGETGTTDNSEEFDVTPYCSEFTISVPDDPWGAMANIVLRLQIADPMTPGDVLLLEDSVAKLKVIGGRPCKIKCGDIVLFDGRTSEPRFDDGLSEESQTVTFDVYDLTAKLESFTFRDDFPLDGFYLANGSSSSAFQMVTYLAGLDSGEVVLSSDSFKLPEIPGQISDEFSYSVPTGDDAKQVLEDLFRNFAASWTVGVRPTATIPQLWFKSPADMGTTPKMTVYRTAAAALAATMPSTQVYTDHRSETEEVNANEVWVTGQDQRTGEIVQAVAQDDNSIDCTLTPTLRPDNWIGEPKIYGVQDKRFRTFADCTRAVELLVPAVMVKRTFGEFPTAEMLWYDSGGAVFLPIWRGDFVTLEDVGDQVITSLQVTVIFNGGAPVTDAKYTYGGFTNAGGNSLGEIQANNNARYARASLGILKLGRNVEALRVRRTVVP